MTRSLDPRRLDVRRFAKDGATLSGSESLATFSRLRAEAIPQAQQNESTVDWHLDGEARASGGGEPTPWLRLEASVRLPMTCQRCLQPVDIDLTADRWFRFVADEDTAALEDEEAEEDVLALSRDFDVLELVEDELLMEIPVAPMHQTCPEPVRLSSSDEDFEAAQEKRKNPFEALQALRGEKPEGSSSA